MHMQLCNFLSATHTILPTMTDANNAMRWMTVFVPEQSKALGDAQYRGISNTGVNMGLTPLL